MKIQKFVAYVRFYVKHFKIRFKKLKEENMANKIIVFSAALRELIVYKSIWKPGKGEKLIC